MPRLFIYFTIALLAMACSKHNGSDNTALYGAWVNSGIPTDTLQFLHKNGTDILRCNLSFNTSSPAYSEMAYSYKNGKLSVALFGPAQPLKEIDSFRWKQQNREFDILGYQLYLIMSSSTTHFTYTKIN